MVGPPSALRELLCDDFVVSALADELWRGARKLVEDGSALLCLSPRSELAGDASVRVMLNGQQLLQVVDDRYQPNDSELPDTGVGIDLERLIAPIFIQSETYGTRASSAVILDRKQGPQMLEQRWQPDGNAAGNPSQSFTKR